MASTTDEILFNNPPDPRVKNWFLMSGLKSLYTLILVYWVSLWLLKKFMQNRKPLDLKNIIYFYNIFQIFACSVIAYGLATSGWTTHYSLGCEPADYSDNPMALRMLKYCHLVVLLKATDFLETYFFILRKKFNQVSTLHIYHHTSTLTLAWLMCKYMGGGMITFPVLLNHLIHVMMYTYYLLSSLGPEWQKRVGKWKSKITLIQMIQFGIMLVQAAPAFFPSCNIPKFLYCIFYPDLFILFYMFYDFYKKSYKKPTNASN